MADAAPRKPTPIPSALATPRPAPGTQDPAPLLKVLCERCSAEMYRMHAVWRCPACGFKTDCCGW